MKKIHHQPEQPSYILIFIALATLLINACGDKQSKSNLRNQFRNDMESYEGWIGIGGYYNIKRGDAHSGQHAFQTDSVSMYSLSFAMPVADLSQMPVRKIKVGAWVKCQSVPASGSLVVSLERNNQVIKYYSFDLKEKDAVANEWKELTGTADVPNALPKDAIVKIYFWNKSKAGILVDDINFDIEN
jgi:hypothetical protein